MDAPTRARVRRALDELKPYLATYIAQSLPSAPRGRRPERDDVHGLLKTMLENWDAVFARTLPQTVRHYLHELRDVRNRWAHEAPFSEDEARRAADTARLVAKAIGAPTHLLDQLASSASAEPGPERRGQVHRRADGAAR